MAVDDIETERVFLSYKDAVAMLPKGKVIHTVMVSVAGIMIGTDWDRKAVLKLLKTGKPELAGDMATRCGHGIVVNGFTPEQLFIATKKA